MIACTRPPFVAPAVPLLFLFLPILPGCAQTVPAVNITHTQPSSPPDASFFQHCAFVCVDIQPGTRSHLTDDQVPKAWKKMGFTAQDVNAAVDYAFDVAAPNARRVADACRRLKLPMIFIHWGCLFPDGMDLDPEIRRSFLAEHGPDYGKWPHTSTDPSGRPADILGLQPGEYVLPKTGQDAFKSSNLKFLLENLGARNLIFVGGHTEACLGKTAASAKRLGFTTLCIQDATNNARESTRLKGIHQAGFNYVLTANDFLALVTPLQANP
jgi:nicotinamidase-related amidase